MSQANARPVRTTETLWWVLTRLCNLACPYCYQGSDHGLQIIKSRGLTSMMPKEVLDGALPWAVRWAQGGLHVQLYGGEPTLAWDVVEAAVPEWEAAFTAAGKGLNFGITTNGTRLTPERRTFLDKHSIGMLLSLDGPPRLHNRTRVHADGRGSWDEIDPESLLRWRPNLEIAWQLDPSQDFEAEDIDEMVRLGFRAINVNLNWLVRWPEAQQLRLQRFFKRLARLVWQGKIGSNWREKLIRAGTVDQKMVTPCGTGLHMLGLTPEGWLYPSQEMAFTVFEPEKAPGTAEHYRVGDVRKTPVIDVARLADVSQIRTVQMKPPAPFDCEDCVAKSASIGGCHCRYVGADGTDPANRFGVLPGYCLAPETPVLVADWTWREIAEVVEGDVVIGFDHDVRAPRTQRTLRRAGVLVTTRRIAERYRIATDTTTVVATADHPWRVADGRGWVQTGRLRAGNKIPFVGGPGVIEPDSVEYERGYLAGVSVGDAHCATRWQGPTPSRPAPRGYVQSAYRLAVKDPPLLERAERAASALGLSLYRKNVDVGDGLVLPALLTGVREQVSFIRSLMEEWRPDSRDWLRGWLAGMFDAEGCGASYEVVIYQKQGIVLDHIGAAFAGLGFDARRDARVKNGVGSFSLSRLQEVLRFASTVKPTLTRKIDSILLGKRPSGWATVRSVESIGPGEVLDLSTTERTFIAAGLYSHNCESMRAAMTGLMQGAWIERGIRPVIAARPAPVAAQAPKPPQPIQPLPSVVTVGR